MTSPSPNLTTQLLLKFSCRHCRQWMQLNLAGCAVPEVNCPRCGAATALPALQEVEGFAEWLKAAHREGKFACPVCRRRITLTVQELEQLHRCPDCEARLVFQLTAVDGVRERPSDREPQAESRRLARSESSARKSDEDSSATWARDEADWNDEEEESGSPMPRQRPVPPPEPPPRRQRSSRTPAPPRREEPLRRNARSSPDDEGDFYDDDDGSHRQPPRRGGSGLPVWLVYKLIVWGIVLLPLWLIILAGVTESGALCVLAGLLFFFGYPVYWVLGRLVPHVLAAFVRRIHCPGCGENYDAVDIWKCGCGYQDHKRRHVLEFKCPLCKKHIGRTNCQRCGCTIRLLQ